MKQLNFLFWNIGNQISFDKEINNIIIENEIDVLILAEGGNLASNSLPNFIEVLLELNNKINKWIRVFYKKDLGVKISHKTEYTEVVDDEENEVHDVPNSKNNYRSVNRIQLFEVTGVVENTLFAAIHFPSKFYHDEITHMGLVPTYKSKIHSLSQKNNRLFIVGDFNMNPFDYGMVEQTCFFSHQNRVLVDKDSMINITGTHHLYYNPCWTLLGDFVTNSNYQDTKRSGGTIHFNEPKSRKLNWYLIDQIIMRQSLIEEFNSSYLKVIEKDKYLSQMLTPLPLKDNKKVSKLNHLPIRFSFNLKTK